MCLECSNRLHPSYILYPSYILISSSLKSGDPMGPKFSWMLPFQGALYQGDQEFTRQHLPILGNTWDSSIGKQSVWVWVFVFTVIQVVEYLSHLISREKNFVITFPYMTKVFWLITENETKITNQKRNVDTDILKAEVDIVMPVKILKNEIL